MRDSGELCDPKELRVTEGMTEQEFQARILADQALAKADYLSKLRDTFAGQALLGIMRSYQSNKFDPKDDAQWCYAIADALLAERAKRE